MAIAALRFVFACDLQFEMACSDDSDAYGRLESGASAAFAALGFDQNVSLWGLDVNQYGIGTVAQKQICIDNLTNIQ